MLQNIHKLMFKHVFAGWPGRSADGSVLKHSPLSQTLPQLMDNNSKYLRDTCHIFREEAFPLSEYTLTVYKQNSIKLSHCYYVK